MKIHFFLLVMVLLPFQYSYSQNSHIEKETWAPKPTIYSVDAKYARESAVVILNKRRVEFSDEGKDVAEYYTLHRIIHIIDDRGIESFNRIYLGFNENSDIVDVRARTILPDGKIIEFDKSNIKDLKEKNGNVYKIFAMDGLEKGCDVEYLYTYKRTTSFFGREEVQESFPILETNIEIIAPQRLKFEIKPYNFLLAATDTIINNKRIMQCAIKETAAADDEKYAFYSANKKRVEFRLSYNDAVQKGERLFTWNDLAKRVHNIYTYYAAREYRKAADIITNNGWDKIDGEEAKIIAVENYVKKNYSFNEDIKSDEGNKLETVIQNKTGGIVGVVRLYAAIFQNLNMNYQFVLTGNREKFIIDKDFENWNNCDYPLFYFPTENKFLAPTRSDYRYPWILPSWGGTTGVFCKNISIGNLSTAIAEVKDIELENYTKSFNDIDTKLELNNNLDSLSIDAKQSYCGYAAVNFRDAFNFSNEEQKTNIIKELAKSISSSDHVVFSEVLNKEFENGNSNTPLIIHIKTKSDELIEKAGDKLIVKIGLAIGPQVEMYQEKPRQEAVNMVFGHIEERRIDFIIPNGYIITNPNDLKIEQIFKEDGELTMGFVSDYELKGNLLSVHIMEQYRKTFYPLSQFDQFRKIINTSSDFNKVVIVLKKK